MRVFLFCFVLVLLAFATSFVPHWKLLFLKPSSQNNLKRWKRWLSIRIDLNYCVLMSPCTCLCNNWLAVYGTDWRTLKKYNIWAGHHCCDSRLAVQNRGFSSGAEGKPFFSLRAALPRCAVLWHGGGRQAVGELQLRYNATMNAGLNVYLV